MTENEVPIRNFPGQNICSKYLLVSTSNSNSRKARNTSFNDQIQPKVQKIGISQ